MSTAPAPFGRSYLAKKALFTLLGNAFRLYAPDGSLAFYVKQRAFRLKEDIVVFADEAQQTPRLRIRARTVLDVSATYDIVEADGTKVGACRREGLRSLLVDSWVLLDTQDQPIGAAREDSLVLALLRRFLSNLIPQTFHVTDASGARVATIRQRFNPFQLGYDVHFDTLDPRMGVALTVLLLAIEGRQH